MAAHDICFTNVWHSSFFMFGKCIPVIRGGGVYQPAVDLCIQKLKLGEWVRLILINYSSDQKFADRSYFLS